MALAALMTAIKASHDHADGGQERHSAVKVKAVIKDKAIVNARRIRCSRATKPITASVSIIDPAMVITLA